MAAIKLAVLATITFFVLAYGESAGAQVRCGGATCTGSVELLNQLSLNLGMWNINSYKGWTDIHTNVCAPSSSVVILRSYKRKGGYQPKAGSDLQDIVNRDMYTAVVLNAKRMNTDREGGTLRPNLMNVHWARAKEYKTTNIATGAASAGTKYLLDGRDVRAQLGKNLIPVFSYGHYKQKCAKHKTAKNTYNCSYTRNGGHATVAYEASTNGAIRLMDPWGGKIRGYGTGGRFLAVENGKRFNQSLPFGVANTRFIARVSGNTYEIIDAIVWGGKRK